MFTNRVAYIRIIKVVQDFYGKTQPSIKADVLISDLVILINLHDVAEMSDEDLELFYQMIDETPKETIK